MALYIYAENDNLRSLIAEQIKNHRKTDSGFDIPMIANIELLKKIHSFSLGIRVAATLQDSEFPAPCLLLPRSSIYKTPFRLCNSIGLIDSGYRGEVQAKVDVIFNQESYFRIDEGTRMFQIVQHNFLPWSKIILVDSLDMLPKSLDDRGDGGFGSTGLQVENHSRT